MFHVICKLPNASHLISGVKFHPDADGGVITHEPVGADVVAKFEAIPGYSIVDLDAAPPSPPSSTAPTSTTATAPGTETVLKPNKGGRPSKAAKAAAEAAAAAAAAPVTRTPRATGPAPESAGEAPPAAGEGAVEAEAEQF